ncbi:hypothetical protein BDZ90DRAFT_117965 [Jaminaea rosea]|uniref:Uncharacterized protein n=1 Tax=Jaminaea rosea TaxID=1569628 RepID=A0A316UWW9_9BASI|nr:hypothetical protein BDZ90DRAFT_117965 [Jaminaea rosea]PWN29722.1 hypothetical protein BDZ90DRAFT_117965 [Jaminaea rosea]
MPPRRSARARNDDGATSMSPTIGQLDDSPRKRKRTADGESQQQQQSGSALTPEPQADSEEAVYVNGNRSPSRGRGKGRGRGRPPKNGHTSQSRGQSAGSPPLSSSTSPSGKGAAHDARRSTRGTNNPMDGASPSALEAEDDEMMDEQTRALAEGALSIDEELLLSKSDGQKLTAALECFAPGLLELPLAAGSTFTTAATGKAKAKAKSTAPSTLGEAFDGRTISLRQIRAYLLALRSPLLKQGNQSASSTSSSPTSQLASLTLVLNLVDEIARSANASKAKVEEVGAEGQVKKEEDDQFAASLDALLEGKVKAAAANGSKNDTSQRASRKYALHMRLSTGDYFSKAVELTTAEAQNLQAGAADLVPIEVKPSSFASSSKVPTLGQRLHRQVSLRYPARSLEDLSERSMGKIVRPLNLYYGAYASSLAPSYDSSNASLSQAASGLVWSTKTSERVMEGRLPWEVVLEGGEEAEEDEVAAANKIMEAPPPPPSALEGLCDNLDPSLDSETLRAAMAVEDSQVTEGLERCATLLLKLQAMQWKRLQRGFARVKTAERARKAATDGKPFLGSSARSHVVIVEDQPGEAEQAIAAQALESLSFLIQSTSGSSSSLLLPSPDTIRSLSSRLPPAILDPALAATASSPACDAPYWGTLDSSLHAPEATSGLAGKVPALVPQFSSNETARYDAAGEQRATNRSLRQRGVPLGVSAAVMPSSSSSSGQGNSAASSVPTTGQMERTMQFDAESRRVGSSLALNGVAAVVGSQQQQLQAQQEQQRLQAQQRQQATAAAAAAASPAPMGSSPPPGMSPSPSMAPLHVGGGYPPYPAQSPASMHPQQHATTLPYASPPPQMRPGAAVYGGSPPMTHAQVPFPLQMPQGGYYPFAAGQGPGTGAYPAQQQAQHQGFQGQTRR